MHVRASFVRVLPCVLMVFGCGDSGSGEPDGASSSTSTNGTVSTTASTGQDIDSTGAEQTSGSSEETGSDESGGESQCGDGVLSGQEECEPDQLDDATCATAFGDAWAGVLSCGAPTSDAPCRYDDRGCEQLVDGAYYVDPDGDDMAAGTADAPWQTWQHAVDTVAAGDVVYIRGGDYAPTERVRGSLNGTEAEPITIAAYPGETPVLNCANVQSVSCLSFDQSSHLVVRGLTVTEFWQEVPSDDLFAGFEITRSHHILVENMVVHDIGTSCFRSSDNDELRYVDCDAYHCVDYLTEELPGNDGTGFTDGTSLFDDPSGNVYYEGCRAWNCGDQGFSSGSSGGTHYRGCWSFDNGVLEGAGHGFKMGWVPTPTPGTLNRSYRNNIAVHNRRRGWDTNDQGYESGALLTVNNFAYQNGCDDPEAAECSNASHGFYVFNTNSGEAEELRREYFNNASFDNEDGEIGVEDGAAYTHASNSWDSAATIDAADFVSLDTTELMQPRKPGGALPDLSFGRLEPDSDLVDAGQVVDGVHCPTAGIHEGEDCLEWFGEAPDIGPFELAE